MKKLKLLVFVVLGISVCEATASVRMPAIFGDNMVLQQGAKLPVWGWADANEPVTVSLCGQSEKTVAGRDGRWMVELEPIKAGGPFEMTIAGAKDTRTIRNILAGEVWIGSGQSNMNWPVEYSNNSKQEIIEANYPKIRLFHVKRKVSEYELNDCEGQWFECSPKEVAQYSAVAYFFGREIHKQLDTPVGLIHTSWGGTAAEAWTSIGKLKSDAELSVILDKWEKNLAKYPEEVNSYNVKFANWEKKAQEAYKAGKKYEEPKPKQPRYAPESPNRPAALFNAMIAPLIPYAIKGVIWYQGESNADAGYQYRKLFPAMITDWRTRWNQGDFGFGFVQLANFDSNWITPRTWPELREAQTLTLSMPNTGMAVTIDIGEANDIHPKNKQDVGKRLALWALAKMYGKDVEYSGPMYKGFEVKGSKVLITFDHAKGLFAKGTEAGGFVVAGEDRKFVDAKARVISDNTIEVWSDQVARPAAVRYGWANNPLGCNIYNAAGLPASPFRTDDWPGVTKDVR